MKRIITSIKSELSFKNKFSLGFKNETKRLYYTANDKAYPVNASRISSNKIIKFEGIKPDIYRRYGEDGNYWVVPDSEELAKRAKLVKGGFFLMNTTYTTFKDGGNSVFIFTASPLSQPGQNNHGEDTEYYTPISGTITWVYRVHTDPQSQTVQSLFSDANMFDQNYSSTLHAEIDSTILFDSDADGSELMYPSHSVARNKHLLNYLAARAWAEDHDQTMEVFVKANQNGYNENAQNHDKLNGGAKYGHLTKLPYARYVTPEMENVTTIGSLTVLRYGRDYEIMDYLENSPYIGRIQDNINNAALNDPDSVITFVTIIQSNSGFLAQYCDDDTVNVHFDFDDIKAHGFTKTNYPFKFTKSDSLQIVDSNLRQSITEDGYTSYCAQAGNDMIVMPWFNVLCFKSGVMTKVKVIFDTRQQPGLMPGADSVIDKVTMIYIAE